MSTSTILLSAGTKREKKKMGTGCPNCIGLSSFLGTARLFLGVDLPVGAVLIEPYKMSPAATHESTIGYPAAGSY